MEAHAETEEEESGPTSPYDPAKNNGESSTRVSQPELRSTTMDESSGAFRSPFPAVTISKPTSNTSSSGSTASAEPSTGTGGFPYEVPAWASVPPTNYPSDALKNVGFVARGDSVYLEVLKSGVILDTISLAGKSFFTVGRLQGQCDICSEHPSCSRFHAVIQVRSNCWLFYKILMHYIVFSDLEDMKF